MRKFDEPIENEEMDGIIVLNDEDGSEVRFEFLDLIEYEGEEYAVLLPLEDGEMLLILRVEEGDDDTDNFVGIDDDETVQAVFGIFKERYKDEFDFKD